MYPYYSASIVGVDGSVLHLINDVISVQAARAFNTAGSATIVIPDHYSPEIFRMHTRFVIWRYNYLGQPSNFGDTVWFMKKRDHNLDERAYHIGLVDAFSMIDSRLVAYTAETMYADKTLESFDLITHDDTLRVDSMMLAYFRENFSDLAEDATRNSPYIEAEGDKKLGPYGEKQASWQQLGATIQDLARQAGASGMNLYYDLVPLPDGVFLFKTWIRSRGVDRGSRSISNLVLTYDGKMITDVHEIDDYTEVATYCYVLGAGSGPSQVIGEVSSPFLMRNDPFARIEMTTLAPDADATSVLQAAGRAALNGRRPKRLVTARLKESRSLRYGVDVSYGDLLSIGVHGRKYDVAINAVNAKWDSSGEDLDIRLLGESDINYDLTGGVDTPGIDLPGEINTAPVANAGDNQILEPV